MRLCSASRPLSKSSYPTRVRGININYIKSKIKESFNFYRINTNGMKSVSERYKVKGISRASPSTGVCVHARTGMCGCARYVRACVRASVSLRAKLLYWEDV